MKNLLLIAMMLVSVHAEAQALSTNGARNGVIVKDEGTVIGAATALNCSGAGITCSNSGGVSTVTVPGGGGNTLFVTVDFGSSGAFDGSVVVTGQAWVTASSNIRCEATANAAGTRAADVDDVWLENFHSVVSNRVVGTGFTLKVRPDSGESLGQYVFACAGS